LGLGALPLRPLVPLGQPLVMVAGDDRGGHSSHVGTGMGFLHGARIAGGQFRPGWTRPNRLARPRSSGHLSSVVGSVGPRRLCDAGIVSRTARSARHRLQLGESLDERTGTGRHDGCGFEDLRGWPRHGSCAVCEPAGVPAEPRNIGATTDGADTREHECQPHGGAVIGHSQPQLRPDAVLQSQRVTSRKLWGRHRFTRRLGFAGGGTHVAHEWQLRQAGTPGSARPGVG